MTTGRFRFRAASLARLAGAALSVGWLCVAAPSRAEGASATQEAQAEDLFQRAKAAMARKEYKEACPLLAESYRLAGGGGTLQNLAVCYEEEGKIAFAYNRFNELRVLSTKNNRPDRAKLADEHLAMLKDRLSRLRIRVPDANKVPGMKVSVDGDDYGEASWGAGIVVNTGSHVVRIAAPGKKPVELRKKVEDEGSLETVDVPKLEDVPVSATPVGPGPGPSMADLDRIASQRALRTTGFVVGGIGLATAAAGGVFGILAMTKNSAAKGACQDNTPNKSLTNTTPYDSPLPIRAGGGCFAPRPGETPSEVLGNANRLRDDARTFANLANVFVPVGLVAGAVGTYLIFRSSGSSEPEKKSERASREVPRLRASVVPAWGGFVVQGEFQ